MTIDSEIIADIQRTAEFVLESLIQSEAPGEYGLEALQWLERFLSKLHGRLTEKDKNAYINNIGAFLGECLCRAYGGHWVEKDGHWGVDIEDGRLILLPFNKVHGFIENGAEDSFVHMFTFVPRLLATPRKTELSL